MKRTDFILKLYAVISFLVLCLIAFSGFKVNISPQSFGEITVERINIVESDGTLKMVLSNKARQHNGMFNGVEIPPREREAGILYFSEEGDEIGGMIFNGNATMGTQFSMTTDQYKNDQVMQLFHQGDGQGHNQYGMRFMQRPFEPTLPTIIAAIDSLDSLGLTDEQKEAELLKLFNGKTPVAMRLFVGKQADNSSGIFIRDQNSIPRLKVFVDADNKPRIQVLDETGQVIENIIGNDDDD